MTPQIKQRLDQIQRGELPVGYKRTKAGVVPVEWEEKRIGDVLTQRKTLQCISIDAPLLSFTIEEGIIDPTDKKSNKRDFLIKDMATKKFALTEVGDIIYNPANLKFGAIHRNNLCRGVVSPIYGIFHGAQNSYFMGYLLHNQRFIDYAKIYTEGTVEKLKTLSADTFKKLKVTLPPLKEQDKIADILSAQDKLIALKEKLIEEKKRQKKYLMQQLLTGKKRLPGFENCWELFTLKTVSTPILRKAGIGQYEILSISAGIGFVNQAQKFGKEIAGEQYKNYTVLKKHEFSYNKGNSKRYPQGCIYPLENRDCAAVPNVFISFRLNEIRCFYGFYKYLFESGYLNKQLYRLINSGVRNDGLLNLYDSDFYNCVIPVPSYDEQKKIANVFFALDKEIISLEKMLQAEKQKKKALMQLLLTGIVRVKP